MHKWALFLFLQAIWPVFAPYLLSATFSLRLWLFSYLFLEIYTFNSSIFSDWSLLLYLRVVLLVWLVRLIQLLLFTSLKPSHSLGPGIFAREEFVIWLKLISVVEINFLEIVPIIRYTQNFSLFVSHWHVLLKLLLIICSRLKFSFLEHIRKVIWRLLLITCLHDPVFQLDLLMSPEGWVITIIDSLLKILFLLPILTDYGVESHVEMIFAALLLAPDWRVELNWWRWNELLLLQTIENIDFLVLLIHYDIIICNKMLVESNNLLLFDVLLLFPLISWNLLVVVQFVLSVRALIVLLGVWLGHFHYFTWCVLLLLILKRDRRIIIIAIHVKAFYLRLSLTLLWIVLSMRISKFIKYFID